jgi:hypothetical protein
MNELPDVYSVAEPLLLQGIILGGIEVNLQELGRSSKEPMLHIGKAINGLLLGLYDPRQNPQSYIQVLQTRKTERTLLRADWVKYWKDTIADAYKPQPDGQYIGIHISPGHSLAKFSSLTHFNVLYTIANGLIHGEAKPTQPGHPNWKGWGPLQNYVTKTLNLPAPPKPFDPFNL